MNKRSPRYRSGDAAIDRLIFDIVERVGPTENQDLVFELIVSAIRLGRESTDRGDLKLINSALKELRYAMGVFAPYRDTPKLSIFGSARTPRAHPNYQTALQLGELIAERGWMVITGAGPGIMAAGVEGAGAGNSFGVGITLPFEEQAAPAIADDPKLINFKYFFTRKLTFMKESHGYALLPGGFGTLDESFELLTLLQTGKTDPAPVVLLEEPGGDYWQGWKDFVTDKLGGAGMISPQDMAMVMITDSVDAAADEICKFYRVYHSMRFVGPRLVLRLNSGLSEAKLAQLNDDFSDIVVDGSIETIAATAVEIQDEDEVDRARIAFRFDRRSYARLRQLMDAINNESDAR